MNSIQTLKLKIGETLILLQQIEALLRIGLMSIVGDSKLELHLRKLLHSDRQTMGMLIRHLEGRVDLPRDFSSSLDQLILDRNIFVHKLVLQVWFDLTTQRGLKTIDKFIDRLLKNASITVHVLISYIIEQNQEKQSELTTDEQKTIDYTIHRIFTTVDPDLGEQTFEDYLKSFISKLHIDFIPKINIKK